MAHFYISQNIFSHHQIILFQTVTSSVIFSDCLSHYVVNFEALLLELSSYISNQTTFCSCHTTSYQAARYVTATAVDTQPVTKQDAMLQLLQLPHNQLPSSTPC